MTIRKTEFLLFSDFHAHNFPFGSKRVPIDGFEGLFNSRLRDAADVLDYIHGYALDRDVRHVLFGGDLFHRRSSVDTDVRAVVVDRLISMAQSGQDALQLGLLTGNHDFGDKFGEIHSLFGLNEVRNVTVHDCLSTKEVGHVLLVMVPFTPSLDKAKRCLEEAGRIADRHRVSTGNPSILLAHLGMQGAKVGSDYVLIQDSDIQEADVPYDSFVACFFGHYHEHQKIFKNGWFIGASHEHSWTDTGGTRGFLHVKVIDDRVTFERIETSAPKFVTIVEGDPMPYTRPNDFVKLVGSQEYLAATDIPAADIQRIEHTDATEVDFQLDVGKLNPEETLRVWAAAYCPPDLSLSEVIKEGVSALTKVSP